MKRPQTAGRTRLIGDGGTPIHEEVTPADNPAVSPLPIEPFNAPERRRWNAAQAKRRRGASRAEGSSGTTETPQATEKSRLREKVVRSDGAEWEAERIHHGCGGEMVGFSSGRPYCPRCRAEWYRDQGGMWRRFGR